MTKRRVLFIGGSGVISSACSRAAVDSGIELFVLNRGRSTARPLPPGVNVLRADIREPATVRDQIKGRDFDAVVDWVAFTPEHVRTDIGLFRGRAGQYVFISSASAYQTPPARMPVTESTPLRNPYWQYSRDKIACEDLLVAAYREEGFPATIVRPSHTYDATLVPAGLRLTPRRQDRPAAPPGRRTLANPADAPAECLSDLFGRSDASPLPGGNRPAFRGVKVAFLTRLGVRRGARGDIMHRISAALACLAIVATAGCGTAQATATQHPAPRPCPRATDITQADSGKTYCVRVGDQVAIILHSTQKNLWQEPLASGNVLKGVPNGEASLVAGATGAWYEASRPGRSVVTSVRPPCRAGANPAGTAYPVKSCAREDRFTVTIIAS